MQKSLLFLIPIFILSACNNSSESVSIEDLENKIVDSRIITASVDDYQDWDSISVKILPKSLIVDSIQLDHYKYDSTSVRYEVYEIFHLNDSTVIQTMQSGREYGLEQFTVGLLGVDENMSDRDLYYRASAVLRAMVGKLAYSGYWMLESLDTLDQKIKGEKYLNEEFPFQDTAGMFYCIPKIEKIQRWNDAAIVVVSYIVRPF